MFICCRCVQSTAQTSWSTSVITAALLPFSSASVWLTSVMPVTTTFRELLMWQNQTCHIAWQVRLFLFLNVSAIRGNTCIYSGHWSDVKHIVSIRNLMQKVDKCKASLYVIWIVTESGILLVFSVLLLSGIKSLYRSKS